MTWAWPEFNVQLRRQGVRYLIVGGANTMFAFLSFPLLFLLLSPMEVSPQVILLSSYACNICVSFISQSLLVFSNKIEGFRPFVIFSAVQVSMLLINLRFLGFVVDAGARDIEIMIFQAVMVGVLLPINFVVSRYVVFGKGHDNAR